MMILTLLQSLALTGGTVHTMAPAPPGTAENPGTAVVAPKVMTILIQDDRIQAIGTDIHVPQGVRQIDCTGKHLVPGLIDGMVNHDSDHDRLYVSAGVTLVRDVGSDLQRSVLERESGARDRGPGPALWISGAVLDGSPPATTAAIVLASPEEAAEKLPRLFELDLNFVSMYAGLSPATWRKVIEITHQHKLSAWGPLIRGTDLEQTIEAGQDGLYYLEAFLPHGVTWDKLEPDDWRKPVEALSGAKLAFTPALGIFAQRLVARGDKPAELGYLGPLYIVSWMADLEVRRSIASPEYLKAGLKVVGTQGKLVKDLYDHGVGLVPGSASPNAWLFPGEALINELELWTRAGVPDAAVLRMATSGAAHIIGADRDRGTLEVGKIADILVVKNDPEAAVSNLRKPDMVVLRGRVLDRANLDLLTNDLRDRQQKLQAEAFKPLKIAEPELPFGDVLLRGMVETRTFGQRISGESYAVVKRPDGSLVYIGHLLTPGSATTADTDVEISQTIQNDEVTEFSVKLTSGPHHVTITGTLAGGSMNIERRVEGGFVDNTPRRERLAFVDVGSVTAELVLGQRKSTGKFRGLYLEDIDPVIGNYEMHVDKDGTHLLKAPTGEMTITFDAVGAPRESKRQQGHGVLQTRSVSARAGASGGLPIPREKPLATDILGSSSTPAPSAPVKKP